MNRIRNLGGTLSLSLLLTAGASAQTWTLVKNTPSISAYNPTLLTDGSVLIQDGDNINWYKLTPDKTGSYVNGTWKKLASTPGYGPLYYASAVLPDGRFFTMGGEYNLGSVPIWQGKGYMYDPKTDKWTQLTVPTGWNNIGDMGSVVLPSGKLMLAHPLSKQCALFDPLTNSMIAPYGTGKADVNDEEGLTLLPNGKIFTIDASGSNIAEIFDPTTQTWTSAGTLPVTMVDPKDGELGPQVLRYDGTIICLGGTPAHNVVYNTKTGTFTVAPDFPKVAAGQLDCADAPACLLPNGNVLIQTSPGLFLSGSYFFEWDGTAFKQVPTAIGQSASPSFIGNFLTLPTGQILYTGQDNNVQVYTPTGKPDPSWAPTITSYPTSVKAGLSFTISGTQFNGLSQGSAYGDDQENATNYPMIRITNNATKHVFYCREYNPSTMAICTGSKIVSTNFQVPSDIEIGASTIEVVTNGIASVAKPITVYPALQAGGVSVFEGKLIGGTLSDVQAIDAKYYTVQSVKDPLGQVAAAEVDFSFPSSSISTINLVVSSSSSSQGVTGMVYIYDWTASQFVYLNGQSLTSGQSMMSVANSTNPSRFIGPSGKVRVIVRGVLPSRLGTSNFNLSIDAVNLSSS